jgi:Flp pilus assembly protein TadD
MGWLFLIALGAGAMALLVALGVPRLLWPFIGAALMLGGAGYAWQGSPTLAGASPDKRTALAPDDPEMIVLRDEMLGRFTLDGAYLIAADAMTASGSEGTAVRVLLGGLNKLPRSYVLWTALGSAYARHDGGQVSPAARFAFDQARRLAPEQPGPDFLEGLAIARTGDLAAVRPYWARALRLTPTGASYRRDVAMRLAMLDRVLAMQRAGRNR